MIVEVKIMKRILAASVMLLLIASFSVAEERHLEPTQNPNAPYRLFSTHNIFTFLRLDTSVGRIWQVQWGGDSDRRFIEPLNEKALVTSGKPGRFTLYPTRNIFTFILVDQETGEIWHVQWGKSENRFIERIPE